MPVSLDEVYGLIVNDNINCEVNGREFRIKCNKGSFPITEPSLFKKVIEDAEIKDGKLVFKENIVSEYDEIFIKDAMLEMSLLYQEYYLNSYGITKFDTDVKNYLEKNVAAPPEFKDAFLACYVAGMDNICDYSEPDIFAVKMVENAFSHMRQEYRQKTTEEPTITIKESDLEKLSKKLSSMPEAFKVFDEFRKKIKTKEFPDKEYSEYEREERTR